MSIVTMTSREFNRDSAGAKKAAERGPVIITDRGKPAHALMSIDEYLRLTDARRSIVDSLADPSIAEIPFDPPRPDLSSAPVDFRSCICEYERHLGTARLCSPVGNGSVIAEQYTRCGWSRSAPLLGRLHPILTAVFPSQ